MSITLHEPRLFRENAYVDGHWVGSDSGNTLAVLNPADQSIIGYVPVMGAPETARAIEAAHKALAKWSKMLAKDRARLLRRWYELILAHQDDLALLMTIEQGKPLSEAKSEIQYAASFVEWYAEEGKRIYGDVIPGHATDKRIIVLKQPIGVVAAITPWNFPSAMITRKCAPALAAGCTVVIKPASETPFSAFALAFLADLAGIPAGVINVVTGAAREIGGVLTQHPWVRKLSFTGSTEVGKILMSQCASTVKKVSLELGGNAPFIVMDDSSLDAAVDGAVVSKFRNAGQTCVCANRFFVQSSIADAFTDRLRQRIGRLTVGNGMDPMVHVGPLISHNAIEKVEDLIDDARAHGAKLVCGGRRHSLGGYFYEPTLLTHVQPSMKIAREEIFGPVATIMTFDRDEQAIDMANDTPYGLAAYFYGRDVGRIWRMAESLEYGIVGVNTGLISTEVAPFGGMKESGIGREGSKYGIDDFLEIKYMCLSID